MLQLQRRWISHCRKKKSDFCQWALAAAEQNHIDGQLYTGECYDQGWGVESSHASAFEWYMKAAEQEEVNAQYYIGQFFEEQLLY